jgi:hypothetical protein
MTAKTAAKPDAPKTDADPARKADGGTAPGADAKADAAGPTVHGGYGLSAEEIAQIAHDVVAQHGQMVGDTGVVPWSRSAPHDRAVSLQWAMWLIEDPAQQPGVLNDRMMREAIAEGWTWGPVFEAAHRRGPRVRPWIDQPVNVRQRDMMFVATVRACLIG